jgi:peptidoglycan hydrolase-like protein with peptidoglycan-binding domain
MEKRIMGTVIGSQFDYFYCEGVQKFLNQTCQGLPKNLTIDGNLGPASAAALSLYQGQASLPVTGVYDAATQAAAEPTILAKYVQTADIRAAAQALGVDVPSVMSVAITESSGSGFNNDGSATILFERHIFYAQLQAAGVSSAQLAAYVLQYPNICNPVTGGYVGGAAEWQRYNAAALINASAAQMSISMGLFQIMGMNFKYTGFSDVGSYFTAMQGDEKAQLSAFIGFVQRYMNGILWTALKAKDWASFAKYYNGPANVPVYSGRLSTNYTTFSNVS